MTGVRDSLSGKQFFITGATGFLGTALVERLLRTVPDSRVVLLIRPGRRATPTAAGGQGDPEERLLRPACGRSYGDRFEAEVASRVSAVAGDVATDGLGLDDEGMQLLSECDIVVHSAATVSFDSPLDTAVEVNLLGPSRVAAAVAAARQRAARRGAERAGPLPARSPPPMWPAPTRARPKRSSSTATGSASTWTGGPRSTPPGVSAATSTPSRGARPGWPPSPSRRAATSGGAGLHLLAERAERLREDWVKKQMVASGQARAQSLGWPDAYPYTKALGERALVSQFGDTRAR